MRVRLDHPLFLSKYPLPFYHAILSWFTPTFLKNLSQSPSHPLPIHYNWCSSGSVLGSLLYSAYSPWTISSAPVASITIQMLMTLESSSLAQTWHLSPTCLPVTYTQVFQRHFNLCYMESVFHHPPKLLPSLFSLSQVKAHDQLGYLSRCLAVILAFTFNPRITSAFFCPYCYYLGYL